VRLIMPWRLPAAPARTLPEAVTLNRFLAADFVFILGILLFLISIAKTAMACPYTGQAVVNLTKLGEVWADKAEKTVACKPITLSWH